MDDDSRSSGGSGPHSPQLNSVDALLRANSQLEKLIRHYQEKNKELLGDFANVQKRMEKLEASHLQTQQMIRENDDLRVELNVKTLQVATLNERIREMKNLIVELEVKLACRNDPGSELESDITLDDEEDSEGEFQEVMPSRNRRKRKNKGTPVQPNNKVKKLSEKQQEEELMETNNIYEENFPAIGENKEKNKIFTTQKRQNLKSNFKNNSKESQRIPPVILRDKSQYTKLVAEFATRKINFEKATTLPEGVKIIPSTKDDFRAMTRLLDDKNIEFHSYQLPEDKLLHVVMRGVLESFSEEEIAEDLKRQGFTPKKIVRFRYKNGRPMPLVLVLVPKEDKGIFNISEIHYNSIKVESQRTRTRSTQCYNCQMFGHSAFGCKAKPKCVKCAGQHSSKTCKLTKEENKAKCANCGGDHPASFGGCPKHPRHNNQQLNAPQRKEFKWGNQENFKLAATPENMGAATNAIQLMNSAMQEFMKNLQKMQTQFASTFMPSSGGK